MLPNLAWLVSRPADAGDARPVPRVVTPAEHIGRAMVLVLPFFYGLDLRGRYAIPAASAMGLALAIYYAAWIRYFAAGRPATLFAAPLFHVPLPLAAMPTLFFLLSSYLMGSWPMAGASILFGIAHLWISAASVRAFPQTRNSTNEPYW